ncbi:Flp family type IVb pilin [Crenobacter intestini]|uniref:Flp family type IVb pilin n=1 Tax=Crenobacter intestini TaxID=2563443 RepID=A0A4T0V127_9NEIS|nr:Flp family type IVb pilin [Crenobacter intestini]TIC85252.1 Flp family type IVb pilin [Crenobacter intestini]
MKLFSRLQRFARDDSGVTSIEYALLGVLIAVAIVGAVGATGRQVQALYESISEQVVAALG